MFTYHQPKAGSAETARGRTFCLGKGRKQQFLLLCIDTDAVIRHTNLELQRIFAAEANAHGYSPLDTVTAGAKLDAIADQVV